MEQGILCGFRVLRRNRESGFAVDHDLGGAVQMIRHHGFCLGKSLNGNARQSLFQREVSGNIHQRNITVNLFRGHQPRKCDVATDSQRFGQRLVFVTFRSVSQNQEMSIGQFPDDL